MKSSCQAKETKFPKFQSLKLKTLGYRSDVILTRFISNFVCEMSIGMKC